MINPDLWSPSFIVLYHENCSCPWQIFSPCAPATVRAPEDQTTTNYCWEKVAPLRGWNAAATRHPTAHLSSPSPSQTPFVLFRLLLQHSVLESVCVCCLVWWRWVGGIRSAELSRASGQGVMVVVVVVGVCGVGAPSPEWEKFLCRQWYLINPFSWIVSTMAGLAPPHPPRSLKSNLHRRQIGCRLNAALTLA